MAKDQIVLDLSRQYFIDIEQDGKEDNEYNLLVWLWFTCPADLRSDVREVIQDMRTEQE